MFNAVLHQVQEQLGHQALIGGKYHVCRHLFDQVDLVCRRFFCQFSQYVRYHIPQKNVLPLQAVFSLIAPGQRQQLGNDAVHPPALRQDGGRLRLRLLIRRMGSQVFRIGHDDGDRGAEFMGSV